MDPVRRTTRRNLPFPWRRSTGAGRLQLIASMEMVNYVLLFDEPDPCNIISILRPNILVKGGDWPADQVVGADIVEASGGKVVVVPYLKGFSTTEIIAKIRS